MPKITWFPDISNLLSSALSALDNTNHDPCTTKTPCLGKRPKRKPRQVTLLNLFATTSQAQSLLSKTAHPDTNSQYLRQWELFASSCLPTTRCRLSSVCPRSHQARSLHDQKSSGEDTLAGQTPGEDTLAGQTPQLFLLSSTLSVLDHTNLISA